MNISKYFAKLFCISKTFPDSDVLGKPQHTHTHTHKHTHARTHIHTQANTHAIKVGKKLDQTPVLIFLSFECRPK